MSASWRLFWLAGVALGSFQIGFAQDRDPIFPWATIWEPDDVFSSASKVDHDFVAWCQIGRHTFFQEKSTLAGIIRTLGRGTIEGNHEDAAGGEFRLDYTDGKNLIRFSSNAEMGGDTHELDGIEIRPLMPAEKAANLPELRFPIIFSFGSCGMAIKDLERRLGSAALLNGKLSYEYEGKRQIRFFDRYVGKKLVKVPGGEVVEYEVSEVLEAKIFEGKVIAIRIAHVTSS